jgi:protein-disulfide isomerase
MSTHLKPPVSEKDHIHGNHNAPIELVEYGDYQCPHCGRAYPVIKRIQKRLGEKLKFVFRNFPLSEIHPDAFNAALAAEAAALQKKFWEMHDIIFENQQSLETESLLLYAKEIGLNMAQFTKDIQKDELVTKVENDLESGIRSGVNGTPSFFVNGKKYDGDWEEEEFISYLREFLKLADKH